MSHTQRSTGRTASSAFEQIIDEALEAYQNDRSKHHQALHVHPLASRLQTCDSPEDILAILQKQLQELKQCQRDGKWTRWLKTAMGIFFAFVATLGAAGLVCPGICTYLRSAISYSFGSYLSYLLLS
jgi:plasmid maintenance system killer protein